MIQTGWEYGFRSAAIHAWEGRKGGYYVIGKHWKWTSGYGSLYLGTTTATGCNLGFFFPYW